MKKYLTLLLLVLSETAFADACIFSGSYVKCLASSGILMDNGKQVAFQDNAGSGGETVSLRAANDIPTSYVMKLPSAQGAAGTALTNDGSGNLDWTALGNARINYIESIDPNNTSSTRHNLQTNLTPGVNSAGTGVNLFDMSLFSDNMGFTGPSTTVLNIAHDTSGDTTNAYMADIVATSSVGDGSNPMTLTTYRGIGLELQVSDSATVTDALAVRIRTDANATGIVTTANAIADQSAYQQVDNYNGVSLQSTFADVNNNISGFQLQGTATNVDGGIYAFGNTINATTVDGQVVSYNIGGTWGTIGGGVAFNEAPQITTSTAGYTSINLTPNFQNPDQYTGINLSPTFQTSPTNGVTLLNLHGDYDADMDSQIVTIDDGTAVAGTLDDNYIGINLHPNFPDITGNFTGINITGVTATGQAGQQASGIYVNTSGITGFDEITAIKADGIVSANVTAPIISAPNATPVHNFNTGFTAADSSTITGIDRFGFGPIMSIDTGDNSTLTSGSFGLGLASLGMINLIDVGAGSTLDNTTGSFVAMVLPSGSGHIDNITTYRAVGVNLGATTTVDNHYGFKSDITLAGALATDSWSFYDSGSDYNWMKNTLKIGGTAGSTDRTSGTNMFEVEGSSDTFTIASTGQVTAPIINSPEISGATVLSIKDISTAFNLEFLLESGFSTNYTSDHTLNFDTKDGNRVLTLGGDLTITGAFETIGNDALQLTTTANTNVTLPTTGTLATLAGTESLSNKTMGVTNTFNAQDTLFEIWDNSDNSKRFKFDATNVSTSTTRTYGVPNTDTTLVGDNASQTLTNKTINGSNNTITNVSLTTGVTGVLPLANGGTNKNATASAGAVAYSDADSYEFTSVGTSGDFLVSAGTGAPAFSSSFTTAKTFDGVTVPVTIGSDAAGGSRAIDIRSGSAQRSELNLYQNGTAKVTIATANGNNDLTPGTTAGDLVIRSQNSSDIFITADGGTTTHARINTNGSQVYGAADANVTVGGYFHGSAAIAAGGDCTANPCTISADYGNMVDTVTRASTGVYTVNFTSSFWSSGPVCVANSTRGGAIFCVINASGLSTTSYGISCFNDAGTASDSRFSIVCHGPR